MTGVGGCHTAAGGQNRMLRYTPEDDELTDADLQLLRERVRGMPDDELRRFGRDCLFLCSPAQTSGKPPRKVFTIQLEEARAEWKRRKQ
jgi:hypothetical protein